MQAIIKSQTFRQFNEWRKAHNADKELTHQVRSNAARTYEMLIHCWAEQINSARAVTPLETNSVSLGKALSLSPRTIRRHLSRLEAAGLLVKRFRGSRANYWISFINLDFIAWGARLDLAELKQFEKGAMTRVVNDKRSSCPHISNSSQYRNTENSNVEMLAQKSTEQKNSTANISDHSLMDLETKGAGKAGANHDKGGRKARERFSGGSGVSPADLSHIISFVVALWEYAATHIFSTLPFLLESQKTAAQHFFFSELAELPKNQRITKYSELMTRLRMVAEYLERHPGKYVQPPEKYFDPANSNGFAGTLRWLEKQRDMAGQIEREKQNTRQLVALRKTLREHRENPDTHTFIRCRNRLAKINPELTRVFQNEVITGQNA